MWVCEDRFSFRKAIYVKENCSKLGIRTWDLVLALPLSYILTYMVSHFATWGLSSREGSHPGVGGLLW